MKNFSIKIDLKKIDKERIDKRGYIGDNGETVEQLMYSLEAIQLKEPKTIKEGDTWVMKKTHFVVNTATKEERDNKVRGAIIGDIIMFEDKQSTKVDEINPSDIPW